MRKRRQRHRSVQPQTSWISSGLACFFFSLSKPSQSMRMVLAIRLFEFRRRKDICSMYAKLLRCTVYACKAALAMGKPQESGETPRISQSASWIFLVNARPFPEQSSSISTCRAGRAWFEANDWVTIQPLVTMVTGKISHVIRVLTLSTVHGKSGIPFT